MPFLWRLLSKVAPYTMPAKAKPIPPVLYVLFLFTFSLLAVFAIQLLEGGTDLRHLTEDNYTSNNSSYSGIVTWD